MDIITTLKELVDGHVGEAYKISGGSSAVFVDFATESYLIDSRGYALERSTSPAGQSEPVEAKSSITNADPSISTLSEGVERFPTSMYPELEKALLQTYRLSLDPKAKLDKEYIWEDSAEQKNYLPLGFSEFPGQLPFEWGAVDFEDYFTFGELPNGELYVDVSYIPLRPVIRFSEGREAVKEIFRRTNLSAFLTEAEFIDDLDEDKPWTENHFGGSEIYELLFEIIEEKDATSFSPSVGYPLQRKRFSVVHGDRFYSIYVHLHED